LNVKIDATGEAIDLNESSETANQSKETAENEETTDERIESITLAREEGGRLKSVKNFKRADNPEHIVVTLSEGNEDTHIKTVWTNLNAGGATNQKLWEKELVTDEENLRADFSLSNSNNKLFRPAITRSTSIWMTNWSTPCATKYNSADSRMLSLWACRWICRLASYGRQRQSVNERRQYARSSYRVSLWISLLPHLPGRVPVCDRFRRKHHARSKDN